MDLSIIILAFRNKEKLHTTLEAVFKSETHYSYEVIVVDNDSKDGTAEMVEQQFPHAQLIRNPNNGFAKGNNRGLKETKGDVVLFLNADTAVQPNVIEQTLTKIKSDRKIGFLGCRLIKADGSLDLAARRSFPNPVNALYRFTHLDKIFPKMFGSYNLLNVTEDQEQEVDSLVGAFMMIRREVLNEIGPWDEDFFMYGEDIEYCYRAKQAGYKNIYYPAVTTIHYKGQSSKKTPFISLYHFHNSMWLFYKKHYVKKYPFFLNWLVYIGIWSRFYLLLIINKLRKNPYVSK
ncbi:MAG: glycosyl transferase family 2 [Candidatus Doudnabacteria bacterium]|nr:glycosyl transferase family 2 [Candidatus Doudnabacteria bacterium]